MGLLEYLSQRTHWMSIAQSKHGELLPIADMDPIWRRSAARWMINHADTLYLSYRIAVLRETQHFPIAEDLRTTLSEISKPSRWIATTPLYQALTEDTTATNQEVSNGGVAYPRG